MTRPYLTTFETAQAYGITQRTVRYACTSGQLPGAYVVYYQAARSLWLIPREAAEKRWAHRRLPPKN